MWKPLLRLFHCYSYSSVRYGQTVTLLTWSEHKKQAKIHSLYYVFTCYRYAHLHKTHSLLSWTHRINVSSRFVQRKWKTLIYMEKLLNPQGLTVVIYHEFLLFSFVRTCKHTRMSIQVGLIQLHTHQAKHTHKYKYTLSFATGENQSSQRHDRARSSLRSLFEIHCMDALHLSVLAEVVLICVAE